MATAEDVAGTGQPDTQLPQGKTLTAGDTEAGLKKAVNDSATLLLASEWLFILVVIGLVIAFKSYSPLMNMGIGLWAGTWVARGLRLGRLSRATPIDLPLLGFAASLLIGMAIAPDAADALARLAIFVSAIGLFYVLVNSETAVLYRFCYGFVGVATVFGLYFASEHPWAEQPAKIEVFQEVGLWLNAHVPTFRIYDPHPNVVAGLLAIATAVWLALMWQGLREWGTSQTRQRLGLIGLGLMGVALGFGVLMTQSRAGWLAIAGAVGLAAFWLITGPIAKRVRMPQWAIFWIGLGFAAGVVAGVVISKPELVTTVFGNLPGPNTSFSRITIYKQVWRLAQDTPFTGGGLAAFPGLYSTYVLSIPTLYLTHAHNSLLNLLVEQGWLGAGSYALVLALVAWFGLLRFNELNAAERTIAAAGLMGLAVIILNGLGDATLVASRVTPAIFIPAGLALGGRTKVDAIWKAGRWWLAGAVAVGIGAAIFYKPLLAQWHANLGTLAQDRVALADWPTNEWDEVSKADQYQPASDEFKLALAIDPDNTTALYRTGLIAMDALDFKTAADNLQRVYDVDLAQRATIKNLGYAYAWLGDYDRAKPLLSTIAESEGELQIYGWWWLNKRGRNDLAENAFAMLGRIH